MHATTRSLELSIYQAGRPVQEMKQTVPLLAFEHVGYHRMLTHHGEPNGLWAVTHLESGCAVVQGLRTMRDARSLATYLEENVSTWPKPVAAAGGTDWIDTRNLGAVLNEWRAMNGQRRMVAASHRGNASRMAARG